MRTFGSYELIASLASGGMSSVWLARSPGADGIVVLKRLLREHLGDPEIVAMFQDEADLSELLRHPNLIRTFEHGVAEGEPYIVLERLEGEDVRSVRRALRKKRQMVPYEVALEILIRACQGLHSAHELRGRSGRLLEVVHRDVSPHNVVVTFDGDVKVLDFGIAKSRKQRVETKKGVLKGKVPYMAPEQIRAERLDRRTDVYALGVLLYELTTGERPYFMPVPSDFAIMMAIVRGDLRWPGAVRPDYPPALEAIVMRALSANPDHRPATAAELEAELAAYRDREGLRSGRDMLREWMASHFAERIAALRAAASPEELAARIADAETRRRAAGDEDDDAETAPKGPSPAQERVTGAQYTLSRRPLATGVLAALAGRINESFDGGAVGRTLAESKLVVLDLSGVLRVTSYGVREWLAMMGFCKETELWLARCSEPVVAQLSTIKGFAGHARVASLLLSFRCDACGSAAPRLLDLELDGAEIAAGALLPRPCDQCGEGALAEDDPTSLLFAKRWLGEPIPAAVRAVLSTLAREDDGAPPPIEKIVLGTETHLRIRRTGDRRIRFRRLLDGIEGHLRIDLREPGALDDRSISDLARALLDLGPEVTSIAVQGAPRALAEALRGDARIQIASRADEKDAPPASERAEEPEPRRESAVSTEKTSSAARSPASPAAPEAIEVTAAPRPAEATPASSHAASKAKTSPKQGIPLALWGAGVVVALAALAFALFGRDGSSGKGAPASSSGSTDGTPSTQRASGPPSTQQTPSSQADVVPPEHIEKIDGARQIATVGRGATDEVALAAARSRALVLLVEAVKAGLPEEVRTAAEPAAAAGAEEIARRFLVHLGAGATPERTSTRAIAAPGERALAVQFRVSDTVFEQATAHFGTARVFRDLRVVPAFPTVAEAGWVVVTAPAVPGAPRRGDRIVAIGAVTLAPTDLPSAAAPGDPELHVARGDQTLAMRWLP